MHPNGQIPAYEWAFGDVNPPVHAWAAMRVYQIEDKIYGRSGPRLPRARVPEAADQLHVVGQPQGRRGQQHLRGRLPRPRQHRRLRPHLGPARRRPCSSRPTARAGWRCTASTCSRSRSSSPKEDAVYEDIATKFFEHFVYIGAAVNRVGGVEGGLWDEDDGFYFDALKLPDGRVLPDQGAHHRRPHPALRDRRRRPRQPCAAFADFDERLRWFAQVPAATCCRGSPTSTHRGIEDRDPSRARRLAQAATHARAHAGRGRAAEPARRALGVEASCRLARSCSSSTASGSRSTTSRASRRHGLFGGNSNWRGPVWFPLNFLLIEALQKHHYFLGDDFKVELPDRLRQRGARCGT